MFLIAILYYFTERFPELLQFFESIYSFPTLADGKMPKEFHLPPFDGLLPLPAAVIITLGLWLNRSFSPMLSARFYIQFSKVRYFLVL